MSTRAEDAELGVTEITATEWMHTSATGVSNARYRRMFSFIEDLESSKVMNETDPEVLHIVSPFRVCLNTR